MRKKIPLDKRTYYVYELSNPLTGIVFYVGYTYDTDRRLKEHLRLGSPQSACIIKILKENNIIPQMRVIYECKNKEQAHGVEKYTIQEYKRKGHFLSNHLVMTKQNYLRNLLAIKRNLKIA